MSASVPLNTIVASLVPVPVVNVRPVFEASEIVPLVTDSVTVSRPPLASTSETDRPGSAMGALAFVVCAAGTTSTGGLLTATSVMVATAAVEERPSVLVAVNVSVRVPLVGLLVLFW